MKRFISQTINLNQINSLLTPRWNLSKKILMIEMELGQTVQSRG